MISDKDTNWVTSAINGALTLGAVLVSDENYQARLEVCEGCPFLGMVDLVVPGVSKVKGCSLCGCPMATKPRYQKYFSFAQLRIIKAECPEGKWKGVDNRFSN